MQIEAWVIRAARPEDAAAIRQLIPISARVLSRVYYRYEQIESAIAHVFGVDSSLIADGTCFVAEEAGQLVGCGGWSKRRTLFGGDQYRARDPSFSDPAKDPARIRAFFVHPEAARRGIGRAILERCEAEARAAGYRRAELMSTRPGVPFYEARGYVAAAPESFTMEDGVAIEFVPMRKALLP